MEFLLAVAIIALVAAFVSGPLRQRASDQGRDPLEAERAELEARKQVVYREIRDVEADHAAGKLAEADFSRLDRELRADAIQILKRLDRLEDQEQDPG